MTATAVVSAAVDRRLLAAFAAHHHLLGGQAAYRRARLAGVETFVTAHPDLDEWLEAPLDARLVELHRHPFAWSVVSFAIVTGRCHADADFLFAKSFGHTLPRWVAGLFPADVTRLRDAAGRLGAGDPDEAVRSVVPLAVAFTGRPPHMLTAGAGPREARPGHFPLTLGDACGGARRRPAAR